MTTQPLLFAILGRKELDGTWTIGVGPEVKVDADNGDIFEKTDNPNGGLATIRVSLNGQVLPTNDDVMACVYFHYNLDSLEQGIALALDDLDAHRDNKQRPGQQEAA